MNELTSLQIATIALENSNRNRLAFYHEWQDMVRLAAKDHSLRTVATFAGVSHARVAQIVRESK